MNIDAWLVHIPHLVVYLLVGVVVGIESLGIPIPGEIVLVSAALLSARAELNVAWEWIALSGVIGAVVGDSIGYALGRKFGHKLFDWLGKKFPRHFGEDHVAYAEHIFSKWGALAVYFGRWIAILRIFAGPLAGALRMPYPRFLFANVLGGVTWAAGTTAAIYYLGQAAEVFLKRFSYIGLGVAVLAGIIIGLLLKRKMNSLVKAYAEKRRAEQDQLAN
ncbi:DedA family protein [Sciscionella marina]|uniref:DedA family protein n=1 Tax=Sciscionella marina TaxID=508770 RepID=UPI00036775CA|nr:DedA family protein [Sciscionella marina]